MKVAAHAHGAQSIKDAILAGADTIEHASLIDDEGIRLAQASTAPRCRWMSTTATASTPTAAQQKWPEEFLRKNIETTEAQRQGFTRAHAAGVAIVFGTDAAVYPHGLNARQFPIMVQRGMTPMEAIQSATSVAAKHMGWADRVGQPAAGTLRRPHRGQGRSARGRDAAAGRGRRHQGRARLQTAGGVKRWRSGMARTTCSRPPKPAGCGGLRRTCSGWSPPIPAR